MMAIERRVYTPPRRRSAKLSVVISDGREVVATVARSGVTVKLRRKTGYGQVDSFSLPRDPADLRLVGDLMNAAMDEARTQIELEKEDAAAKAMVTHPAPTLGAKSTGS